MHISQVRYERPFDERTPLKAPSSWPPALLLVLWLAFLATAMALPLKPAARMDMHGVTMPCPACDGPTLD